MVGQSRPTDDAMSHSLHVVVQDEAGHTVVAVAGRVFHDTVEPLHAALTQVLDTDRPHIVIDMSAVEICDSSGLNLFARSHHTATARGGWLRLAGLRPIVRRVVDATNLDRLLSIYTTVTDAAHGRLPDTADRDG
jgi:anti-anti-sigma factor